MGVLHQNKRLMLSIALGRLGGATAAAQRRPESPVLRQNIWRKKHSDSHLILLRVQFLILGIKTLIHLHSCLSTRLLQHPQRLAQTEVLQMT